ncbi:MAG: AsmA-like C-terminal domain-containing protein [Alphaproteobacteria bacterium]
MIQRTSLLIVELAAALLTGLVLLAAGTVWLLSSGPIPLTLVKPYLESALTAEDGSVAVTIGSTAVAWGGWERAVEILAADVRVASGDGQPIMVLPEAAVGLSFAKLLRGQVAPTNIDVSGAHATLERSADGSFNFGIAVGEGGRDDAAGGILRRLLDPAEQGKVLGPLRRVRILNSSITYIDRARNVEWRSAGADLIVTRGEGGVAAHATAALELNGRHTQLDAALSLGAGEEAVQASLHFENLHPETVAVALGRVDALNGVDLPMSGDVTARFSEAQGIEELQFAVTSAGWLNLPGRLPRELRVTRLELAGTVGEGMRRITLDKGYVDFDGPALHLEATGLRIGEEMQVRLHSRLAEVPMADLENYWPIGLGKNARDWTTANIRDGIVRSGQVDVLLGIPLGDPAAAAAASLSGTLNYEGLSVRYMPGMPKVTDIDGTATFDLDSFDLLVRTGRLDDIKVEQASINMFDLDTDIEKITIDIGMRGPLRTALEVLDHEPLHLIGPRGIETRGVSGDATARLTLNFPLKMALTVDDISKTATASLRDVALSPGPFDLDVRNGTLALKIDDREMHVEGRTDLNGVPVALDWVEKYGKSAPFRSRYRLKGTVDDTGRAKLGLPTLAFVAGAAVVEAEFQTAPDGSGKGRASADLSKAVLAVPQLALLKPEGKPGRASADLTLSPSGHPSIDRLDLKTDETEASGSIAFEPGDHSRWRLHIARFRHGRNDVSGDVAVLPGGGVDVQLRGKRFDIGPLAEGDGAEAREQPADAAPPPPLHIQAQVDLLDWGPKRQFRNVVAEARREGKHWRHIAVTGEVENGAKLRLDYGPGEGGYAFRLVADDAGRTLKALNWSDEVRGGTILVQGRRRDLDGPLEGDFRLANYKLTEVPVMARLLQVASVAGVFAAIGQDGMDFEAFEGSYVYRDGRLTFERSRAYGSTLGITMEGTVDTNAEVAELRGTLIPAYMVSRVLGAIPLLGTLITGGENEGLFGASYRVSGRLDDPEVSVNPLSALAPGFLRRVFGVIGDAGQDAEIPPATPSP